MKLFSKCELFHFLLLCSRQAPFVTWYGLDNFLDSHSLKTNLKIFMNSLWKIFSFHADIYVRKENGLCNLPLSVFCLLLQNINWCLWGFIGFSVQIFSRKQPGPVVVIKPLLSSGPANLHSSVFYSTFDLIFQKQENCCGSLCLLNGQCNSKLMLQPAPHTQQQHCIF